MVNVRCTTDTSELCNTEKSRSKESIFFRICFSFCTVFPLFLNFPYPVNHFPNHEKELSLFLLTKSRKIRSACSICFIKHNSYEIKEALEFSFQSGYHKIRYLQKYKKYTIILLSSRLYCRLRNCTESCLAARGLYHRWGLAPRPEDFMLFTRGIMAHFYRKVKIWYKIGVILCESRFMKL